MDVVAFQRARLRGSSRTPDEDDDEDVVVVDDENGGGRLRV
jgi:hypothetical protein